MKRLLAALISFCVRNDAVWSILDATVLRAARYADALRKTHRAAAPGAEETVEVQTAEQPQKETASDRIRARHAATLAPPPGSITDEEALRTIAPDLIVRHGPFKGMRYVPTEALGSRLVPKLMGCYERELHPVIERICSQRYSGIVDIGCGEGYYAVGLALRHTATPVYAYDSNETALEVCGAMAELNGVSDRMTFGSFCDSETLETMPCGESPLIVSDCEGYEKELFTRDMAGRLANCELLVEIHDFIDLETSSHLREVFEESHEIEVIQSLDDIKKAYHYDYPELAQFDIETRRVLVGEYRPGVMEWYYMVPRGGTNKQLQPARTNR